MHKESRVTILKEKWLQLIAVLTGTIGAISDGMQYGWTAPTIPILESEDSHIHITPTDELWLENIYMFGGLAGLGVTIWCVDKFGRKLSIIFAAIQHIIAWLMIAFATRVEVLYAARFLAGLAGDVAFVSIPMYIAEISDKQVRGFLGTFIYSNMMVGVLVLYSVAPFTSIANTAYVGVGIVAFQILSFASMPESPYFYLVKGKQANALKSLQRLRNTQDVKDELEEISKAVERQQSEKGRLIDLFIVKSNLQGVIIMTVLNAAQHLSSISVMLMNLHTILSDAETFLSSNTASIIVAALMLLACVSAASIIDKFGRKKLLILSSILTGISLTFLSTYFAFKNYGYDVTSVNWVPVASVIMYSLVFKFGLGLVPIVTTGELFPTNVKAMGMTLADAMYVSWSIISIYIYIYLTSWYGMHVPFFIFAGCCYLTAIFTWFYIPETKGRTLEEIQLMLRGMKK